MRHLRHPFGEGLLIEVAEPREGKHVCSQRHKHSARKALEDTLQNGVQALRESRAAVLWNWKCLCVFGGGKLGIGSPVLFRSFWTVGHWQVEREWCRPSAGDWALPRLSIKWQKGRTRNKTQGQFPPIYNRKTNTKKKSWACVLKSHFSLVKMYFSCSAFCLDLLSCSFLCLGLEVLESPSTGDF